MRTIQLYGTGAASANAVAQVTIPTAGKIKGIQFSLSCDQVADNSVVALELTKAPAAQISTNGALDPFFTVRVFNNLVTSGMQAQNLCNFIPVDVDVRQGELIYLHAVVTTSTYYFTAILWYA